MHRRKLLELIAEYESVHPTEFDTVERFRSFINSHQRCFERDCWDGHITGSAWVIDPEGSDVLLTHHKKLDIWVQLGGHSDGESDTPQVALREANEEGGVPVSFVSPAIFDLDVHEIPARKSDPAHYHYDVRFAFYAEHCEFVVSEESNDLAWVAVARLADFSQEQSMLRMAEKWLNPTKNYKR
jgi:8-oxo-dGTP pyrophosphatase MutT (NUDIX family)